jgi:hypothetical protein
MIGFTSLTLKNLRIAKKYGCSFLDKWTSGTSCGGAEAPKPKSEVEENSFFSENTLDLQSEKTGADTC